MMVELICKSCRKPFFMYPSQTKTIRGPRMYCSMACRSEGNAVYKDPICRWCGQKPKRRERIFCSKVCKGAYQKTLKLPKHGQLAPRMMKENRNGV